MLNELAKKIYVASVEKGFWEGECSDGTKIALVHSELSEMLEALRAEETVMDRHLPDRSNAEVECADAIIRLLDFAESKGWDIQGAVVDKMEYNTGRPYKHGKRY